MAEHQPGEWHEKALEAARAAGFSAGMDAPDSLLIAEFRNLCPPGGLYDRLAEDLAEDLAGHAGEPVTRATCYAMARCAANLKGLAALGIDAHQCLAILGFAAAKLEMRAAP
jgi:hypothetical protein